MTLLPLPMGDGVYRNVDQSEVSDKDIEIIDAYCDELKAIVKRPGAALFQDLQGYNSSSSFTPLDGLYWWEQKGVLVAVIEGEMVMVQKSLGVYTPLAIGNSAAKIPAGVRPTFASDGTYLVAASGGQMVYTTQPGGTNQAYVADGDAPTAVSHVAILDGFYLANQVGTQKFFFSALNDPTSWDPLDFAQAVGSADLLVALHVVKRNIYLFGTKSIEIWQNDGSTPFSRVDGGFLNSGTISPYSIIQTEDDLYWLDDVRRFVHFNGATVEEIECPYNLDIELMADVSDCTGDRIRIAGQDFFVWAMKSANKTLVWNRKTNTWSKWGDWNSDTMDYDRWIYNAHAYCKDWGFHVVGRRNAPIIDIPSKDSLTDGDSSVIRPSHRTGNIDHGSLISKRCNFLRLRAKTGEPGTTQEPKIMLRWRDDDTPNWSNERPLSLLSQGKSNLVVQTQMLGIFSARQWEFSCSDPVHVSYLKAEIDVDLLGQ